MHDICESSPRPEAQVAVTAERERERERRGGEGERERGGEGENNCIYFHINNYIEVFTSRSDAGGLTDSFLSHSLMLLSHGNSLRHHCFKKWLGTLSAPIHFLNKR